MACQYWDRFELVQPVDFFDFKPDMLLKKNRVGLLTQGDEA